MDRQRKTNVVYFYVEWSFESGALSLRYSFANFIDFATFFVYSFVCDIHKLYVRTQNDRHTEFEWLVLRKLRIQFYCWPGSKYTTFIQTISHI